MDRAKIVDYFLEKVIDKDFTILDVRRELEKNNIDEEIRIIVRLVDNELQRRLVHKSKGDGSKELVWFGGIVTLAGLILTIGTYTGGKPLFNCLRSNTRWPLDIILWTG